MTWKQLISRSAPLLLIIVLISYFAGDGWSAIPSGLVAWGTILLAYATFSLIQQSKEQETRRIEAEQAEAKNNNNLRILDEVIQWATDIMSCRVATKVKDIEERRLLFDSQFIKGRYIWNIVKPFNQELVESVKILRECLLEHIKLVGQLIDTPIKIKSGEHKKKLGAVQDHGLELTNAFIKVIDEAVKIKLSILRQ